MNRKKRTVSVVLAALLALTVCTGAALAYCQSEADGVLYCGGHHGGGHHGGNSGHGTAEACDWLFHAYGTCTDVNCTDATHAHRCTMECTDADHLHYGVCQYTDGTLALTRRMDACGWRFHACGTCTNVNCTLQGHAHRCAVDCSNPDHQHYGVCRYTDGALTLTQRTEACDWLFHAYGDCADVNCTDETHLHRCSLDCGHADHQHYGVCRYANGTLALLPKAA